MELKNNLTVFFGIFLVSMLFVPASIPPAAAEDYEIPAWSKNNAGWSVDQQITDRDFVKGIKYLRELVLETPTNQQSNEYGVWQNDVNIPNWIKNNAGWWADEQITDRDFIKGIKYLMDNLVLQIPTNQQSNEYGVLKLDSFQYEKQDGSHETTSVLIFGKFSGIEIGDQLTVKITKPDGKITQENTKIIKGDIKFTYQFLIKRDYPIGEYQITISTKGDHQLGPISFVVKEKSEEEKSIPFWIKNTAGWWATDMISNVEFVNALQFLVKEDIIKVEQRTLDVPKGMDPDIFIYRTKIIEIPDKIIAGKLIKTEPFTAIMVYTTQNENCSTQEKSNASDYAKMTEHLLNKLPRPNKPTEVIGVCMEMHEITENTYPFTLKELGIPTAQMVIYVGGLEANFESYNDKSAVGWWKVDCAWVYGGTEKGWKCARNQIVVCDECRMISTFDTDLPPVNARDSEIPIERGMFTLAHEIGHSNHYEKNGDGVYFDGLYKNAYATSIHDNQKAFDYCHQQGLLENELCKKLYEKVKINDRIYIAMNINYAINNWKGEQKEVLESIKDLVGSGAKVEGFNRTTYTEMHEKDETGLIIPKDIFSIEFPDDWKTDDYKYTWPWWWGNGTTNPKDQLTEPCCDVWEADKATLKFQAQLWKLELCTACAYGLNYILSEVMVWLLENVHSAGESDQVILDVIEDGEWEWCNGLTIHVNGFECQNFEVREKTVYLTDEGRKAYTVVYEFTKQFIDREEPLNFQIKHEPMVYTSTEIHDGNDAWYITTETMKDVFDKNPEQYYRFIESFTVIDYNTPR